MLLPKTQLIIDNHITSDQIKPNDSTGWLNQSICKGAKFNYHSTGIAIGTSLQEIAKEVLKSSPSENLVLSVIAGAGVTEEEKQQWIKTHQQDISKKNTSTIILTRLPVKDIKQEILRFSLDRKQTIPGTKKNKYIYNPIEQIDISKFSKEVLSKYSDLSSLSLEISALYIDIVVYKQKDGIWIIIEVKSSGDEDSRKAPATLKDAMILPYICLGNISKKMFLAVFQNTRGYFKRGPKKGFWRHPWMNLIGPDVLLLEKQFGDFILDGTSDTWDDFVDYCDKRIENLKKSFFK